MPAIVAELELSDIEMEILFADLVEGADAAAFDQRPEALNRVCVDRTNNVFTNAVIDGRVQIFLAKPLIASPLIGAKAG